MYELDGAELNQVGSGEAATTLKCGSFAAAAPGEALLAAGTLGGRLQMLDLSRPGGAPLWDVQAHRGGVNALDAHGGQVRAEGAREAGRHSAWCSSAHIRFRFCLPPCLRPGAPESLYSTHYLPPPLSLERDHLPPSSPPVPMVECACGTPARRLRPPPRSCPPPAPWRGTAGVWPSAMPSWQVRRRRVASQLMLVGVGLS